jgi:hypothetical protein
MISDKKVDVALICLSLTKGSKRSFVNDILKIALN